MYATLSTVQSQPHLHFLECDVNKVPEPDPTKALNSKITEYARAGSESVSTFPVQSLSISPDGTVVAYAAIQDNKEKRSGNTFPAQEPSMSPDGVIVA